MTAYKVKVTVMTNGKEYRPGSILPADISSVDLAFLKEKKFVELADVPEVVTDEDEEEFEGFDEMDPGAVKSEDEIRKIRTKKELVAYAASIGYDLREWKEKSVKILQEEIINYQEEQIGEREDSQEAGKARKTEKARAFEMRSFKDQLEKDFDSTFFNMNEFAELHNIDGKEVPVVVDNDTLLALNLGKNADSDGIFEDAKLFFILKKYLDSEPVIGQIMDFDGESYPIGNILEDFGGYTIILRGNES